MKLTHREKTEEEEKVIEEVRKTGKQWMGETSMDEVEKPEPEGERVNLKINQTQFFNFFSITRLTLLYFILLIVIPLLIF